jgi:hypothetical protein
MIIDCGNTGNIDKIKGIILKGNTGDTNDIIICNMEIEELALYAKKIDNRFIIVSFNGQELINNKDNKMEGSINLSAFSGIKLILKTFNNFSINSIINIGFITYNILNYKHGMIEKMLSDGIHELPSLTKNTKSSEINTNEYEDDYNEDEDDYNEDEDGYNEYDENTVIKI